MKIYFVTVVWGTKHTNLFLQIALPSLLSDRNFGKLEKNDCYVYKIYTTSSDAKLICNSRVYHNLCQHINIEIVLIDEVIDDYKAGKIKKISAKTLCEGKAIREINNGDNAFVSINPDAVFPDNFIRNIVKITLSGKRMIVCGAIRVDVDNIQLLLKDFYRNHNSTICISPRELVKISLKNINLNSKICFWDSPNFLNDWPSYLYWDVKGKGILQRGIHLHPVMINPVRRDEILTPYDGSALYGFGIDGHPYILYAVPDINDVYIASDSDELFFISLDDPIPPNCVPSPQKPSIHEIASWIQDNCISHHIEFMKAKIRYHSEDLSPEWEEVEKESDKIIHSILACMEFYEKAPSAKEEFKTLKSHIRNLSNSLHDLMLLNAIVSNALSETLCCKGRVEEAESLLLKTLTFVSNYMPIHRNLGKVYLHISKYEKAINHLELYLSSSTGLDQIETYHDLGVCYMNLERYQKAKFAFETAITLIDSYKMNPNANLSLDTLNKYYLNCTVNLIKCLLFTGDLFSAKDLAQKLLINKNIEANTALNTDVYRLLKKLQKFPEKIR